MPKKRPRKTKSRSNGEGSIFQLADGRWRAVLTVGFAGGRQRRRSKTERTQADARVALDELKKEHSTGDSQTDNLRLGSFLDAWLTDVAKPNLRPTTFANYELHLRRHVKPYLGNRLVRKLKPIDVQNWLTSLRAAQVGGSSQQKAYNVFATAMDHAVRMQLCSTNPVSICDRPQHSGKEIDPFTQAEAAFILKKTRGTDMHVACVLGLYLGIREGELFGLRWIDYDRGAATLQIVQQAHDRGEDRFAKPKTKSSRRTIGLSPVIVAAIEQHRAIQMQAGQAGCQLVFPAPEGNAWQRSNFIRRRWKPLLASLAIRHRGFHHARHSAATHMLAAGVPAPTVAHILGHARASITLAIYAHYLPDHAGQAAETIQTLYG